MNHYQLSQPILYQMICKTPDIGAEKSQDTKKILSPKKDNQPYITRSGRVVKPKIIVSV